MTHARQTPAGLLPASTPRALPNCCRARPKTGQYGDGCRVHGARGAQGSDPIALQLAAVSDRLQSLPRKMKLNHYHFQKGWNGDLPSPSGGRHEDVAGTVYSRHSPLAPAVPTAASLAARSQLPAMFETANDHATPCRTRSREIGPVLPIGGWYLPFRPARILPCHHSHDLEQTVRLFRAVVVDSRRQTAPIPWPLRPKQLRCNQRGSLVQQTPNSTVSSKNNQSTVIHDRFRHSSAELVWA